MSRRALLVSHTSRPDIVHLAREVVRGLSQAGFEVRILAQEAADLAVTGVRVVSGEAAADGAEIVLVLGGDGTFLRAAELARPTGAPLLGVNLGRVGFLAETEPDALPQTIEQIVRQEYIVEDRLTLDVTVHLDGEIIGQTWALNEASVEKVSRERMLEVVLAVDGRPLTSFGCDGVLCATPTGSTAYAFSAGGPVVWPEVEALLVVPNSAHALFARPLVTGPASVIGVHVSASGHDAVLFCDGRRSVPVPAGGRVEARRSERYAHVVRLHRTPFSDRLVAKFQLPVQGFRDRNGGPPHVTPQAKV
ncbi:MAG TPA: NAD kinase [Mycobacteriales bacterium]|nr:NAD kinase [Mycobacteriales bacterium]